MAPLTLEGVTLGQRHRHFNKLVNDALTNKVPFDEIKAKEEKSDIDKLFKIDIASKYQVVDYILETLKSDDLLHVSRAIKQSTWLINDQKYSHIINPQYLNDVLFPEMTAKASCKFMLHVRLNLKDEDRVEKFYKFFEDKGLQKTAFKWLPNCSLEFIKQVVAKKTEDIDKDLFKRLCERSIDLLELYVEKSERIMKNTEYAKQVMFLMNTDMEKYLNVVEKLLKVRNFNFGPKYTELILKTCPERIIDNFEIYAYSVDTGSLGKYLGKAKAKEFLLKHVKNEQITSWFTYDNIAKITGEMPKEQKFELIKQVFIDKTSENSGDLRPLDEPYAEYCSSSIRMRCSAYKTPRSSNKNIYQWYKHAPFSVAFTELKKLIRAESSPDERIAMMSVMLIAAGSNTKNVETVLQYYHDRHINEPFKFKVQFVDHLLAATSTHRFDEKTWKLLEELFHSMEVYIDSGNRVTNCVNSIILYKVLHDECIPEAIEKKFIFHSFKKSMSKLNTQEKEKMFKYLLNYIEQKLSQLVVTNQEDYAKAITLVNDFLDLLLDWKKDLIEYPMLLKKVKEIMTMKKENAWAAYTADIYDKNKSWRKHFFEHSLVLSPSEEACINALKHDPDLLKRCSSEMDVLRYDDNVSLKKLLSKLRVYWPESLASEWATVYRGRLQQTGGHKAVVRALCTLLPPDDMLQIIKKYAPENNKIIWSEADELELSLQKNIAKNMHTARPQPPPDAVLWYAKGDYLQFALPSLSAIFYNLSAARCRQHFSELLDAPVSVQKHGIRLICSKMKFHEIKETLSNTWTTSKNSSIRNVIFQLTYDLLCHEKSPDEAEDLWQMLQLFIDNLTQEENKNIYTLMGEVSAIPINIRARYLMKSYKFLKSLPAKFGCKDSVENLARYTTEIMDKMDPEFVKGIILEHFEQFYVRDKCQKNSYNSYNTVIASYLLWGETEEAQLERCEVLVPIMNYVFPMWNYVHDNQYVVKKLFSELISSLFTQYTSNILRKEIVAPAQLFKNILNKMEESLIFSKNYMIMRIWQLKVAFVHCSAGFRSKLKLTDSKETETECRRDDNNLYNDQWNELCQKFIPDFGAQCIRFLKQDTATSPILYASFGKALSEMLNSISFNQQLHNALYEVFLSDKDLDIYGYLVVLKLMPRYFYDDKDKECVAKYLELIRSHPSVVVQMQYDIKFADMPIFTT